MNLRAKVLDFVQFGGPSETVLQTFRSEVLIEIIHLDNALGKRTRGAVVLAGVPSSSSAQRFVCPVIRYNVFQALPIF